MLPVHHRAQTVPVIVFLNTVAMHERDIPYAGNGHQSLPFVVTNSLNCILNGRKQVLEERGAGREVALATSSAYSSPSSDSRAETHQNTTG